MPTLPAMPLMVELLLPEVILAVGACFILLVGLLRSRSHSAPALALLYLCGALYTAGRLAVDTADTGAFVVPALNTGSLVWYVRLVTLSVGTLIVLVNRHVPADKERGEFFAMLLLSLCGVSLVAAANNLVLLFLALELVSVPTYVLIGLSRRDIRAQEATAKYFFLGAFAAAITLYGFSFLYGASGTMTLQGNGSIASWFSGQLLSGAEPWRDPLVLTGLMLSLGGLAFKIAAVPMHFYAADVYQGAAAPVTGILGFVPKFAGFIAIMQLLAALAWQYGDAVFWLLWALAAATMTVGNTLALMQHNVKRLLAYSSVAHTGYMLMALVAGPAALVTSLTAPLRSGLTALLFYMAVYGVMNLGAFAALSYFRKSGPDDADGTAESLDDLAGSARRHPWATLALSICVLGLMGFPLTGGFFGKLYIFSAALSASGAAASSAQGSALMALVIIGALNAAVAAAYYLRILASCYLRKPAEGISPSRCHALGLSLAICALLVLAAFALPHLLYDCSADAVGGLSSSSAASQEAQASDLRAGLQASSRSLSGR